MDVQEETIGQFTGLYDKNKVPIYEGDIVDYLGIKYIISWHRFKWIKNRINRSNMDELYDTTTYRIDGEYKDDFIEVIGNIYENSDLLGE